MEYMIVSENDPYLMSSNVNALCGKGWVPHGSPMVAATDGQRWFHYQAMTRKTPKTAEDSQNSVQQTHEAISLLEYIDELLRSIGQINAGSPVHERINAVLAKQHHA